MSFHSVPGRGVRENSTKLAKKLKKLEKTIMAYFQAKIGWKSQGKRENAGKERK